MKGYQRASVDLGLAVAVALLLVASFSTPVNAEGEEDRPGFSGYTDVLSQYVWRGYALSQDSAVIQPSMTVGYKGVFTQHLGEFRHQLQVSEQPFRRS